MKIGTVKPAVIAAAFAFTAVAASAYGTNDYEMILKTGANDDRVEMGKLFYAAAESGGGVAEYTKAAKLFYVAAAEQHPVAQYWLSRMYSEGLGLKKRPDKAFVWAFSASEKGDAEAQNLLGVYYTEGTGTDVDMEKAAESFMKSARQGNAKGQYNLAASYESGAGIEKNPVKAVDWYKRAARQDLAVAQYSLGTCYEYGIGVQVDYDAAILWYSRAADQGDARGQVAMGKCFELGRGVRTDPANAAAWFREAAGRGDPTGQIKLAECFDKGYGVARSPQMATELFAKAAESGDESAQLSYATRLELGIGTTLDKAKAAEWYARAAGQGSEKAGSRLATLKADSAAIEARTEAARGSELVFKGLYLGMPIDDAVFTLESLLLEAGRGGTLLYVTAGKDGGKQIKEGVAIEVVADDAGAVESIFLDNSTADALFASVSLSNDEFIRTFLDAYGLAEQPRSDKTAPIVLDGRQVGTQRRITYSHESGYEVVFFDSYVVFRTGNMEDSMKLGLCRPIGSFQVRRTVGEKDQAKHFN